MANHDRYEMDILNQLTRIANALERIEKYMPMQIVEPGKTYMVLNKPDAVGHENLPSE